MMSPRPTIAELIDSGDGPLVLPGVGGPLEATIAAAAGFEAIYVSGYATAGWQLAKPDIGLSALGELIAAITAIRGSTDLPLLVDADTGYGDVSNVVNTVRRLEQAGVSGIQLEDQTWPKRCGHLDGKTVEPAEVMVRKISAAVACRSSADLFIVARTDARSPLGMDEALRRTELYREAGADAVFVDAPQSLDEVKLIGSVTKGHLVANMSESGLTPIVSAAELGSWGYNIILYPTGAMRCAARAIQSYFGHLREHGDTIELTEQMLTLGAFNTLVGIEAYRSLEDTFR